MNELEQLGSLLRVEPPAELDALVQRRLEGAVAALRADALEERQKRREPQPGPPAFGHRVMPERARPAPAVALPLGERFVYTAGLLAFGAQAAQLVARFVWRALAG